MYLFGEMFQVSDDLSSPLGTTQSQFCWVIMKTLTKAQSHITPLALDFNSFFYSSCRTTANTVWRMEIASDCRSLLQAVKPVSVQHRVCPWVDVGEADSQSFLSSSAQDKVGSLSESFRSHTQSREGSCLELSCIRSKKICCPL